MLFFNLCGRTLPPSPRLFLLSYLQCDVTPSNKHVYLKETRSTVCTEDLFIQSCFPKFTLFSCKGTNGSHVSPPSTTLLINPIIM